MESQLSVRLPKELRRALDAASRKMNRKSGDIVRMALRQFLGVPPESGERPAERVRGLIGSLESGIPDLAEQHRNYILQSIKNAR
jgi:metal-responsive CopG/Arc/MetJ family transcriptional regulator